jgi:hypothetical protein
VKVGEALGENNHTAQSYTDLTLGYFVSLALSVSNVIDLLAIASFSKSSSSIALCTLVLHISQVGTNVTEEAGKLHPTVVEVDTGVFLKSCIFLIALNLVHTLNAQPHELSL